MKEKLIIIKNKVLGWLIVSSIIIGLAVIVITLLSMIFKIQLPSFSWWSATFLSDNKSTSVITEVESSGHNIRAVQFIDTFGRVCTVTFANTGTGIDCDYPREDMKNLKIEDYKQLIKDKR